jgi:hypothetical protein
MQPSRFKAPSGAAPRKCLGNHPAAKNNHFNGKNFAWRMNVLKISNSYFVSPRRDSAS